MGDGWQEGRSGMGGYGHGKEARSKKQEAVFVSLFTPGKGKTSGVVEEWKE